MKVLLVIRGKEEMDRQTSLKQLFQNMIPVSIELLQGTIISTHPLKIKITNDNKLIIEENITVIPQHLTDYKTDVDILWGEKTSLSKEEKIGNGNNLYRAELMIHNALKKGEVVHVLSLQNGKKYYVLDRV